MMKVKQSREEWEHQYGSGAWDYLSSASEFAHYAMVAAYIQRREQPASLLDLGCGEGILLRYLNRELINKYTGVDFAQSALDRIGSRQPTDEYICSALEDYRPDRKWDVILFNEVLYFMYDPVGVLEIFENSLNPGGCIVVSMHQKSNPFCYNNRCFRKVLNHVSEPQFEIIDRVEINNGARWNLLIYRPLASEP